MPRRGGRVAGAVFPGILPRPAEGFALILRPQGRPGGYKKPRKEAEIWPDPGQSLTRRRAVARPGVILRN